MKWAQKSIKVFSITLLCSVVAYHTAHAFSIGGDSLVSAPGVTVLGDGDVVSVGKKRNRDDDGKEERKRKKRKNRKNKNKKQNQSEEVSKSMKE